MPSQAEQILRLFDEIPDVVLFVKDRQSRFIGCNVCAAVLEFWRWHCRFYNYIPCAYFSGSRYLYCLLNCYHTRLPGAPMVQCSNCKLQPGP